MAEGLSCMETTGRNQAVLSQLVGVEVWVGGERRWEHTISVFLFFTSILKYKLYSCSSENSRLFQATLGAS